MITLSSGHLEPSESFTYSVSIGTAAADPRTAPSDHVTMSTHAVWVHPMGREDVFDREKQPPNMQLCLPFRVLQCLAGLRTAPGPALLKLQLGRHSRVPRHQCVCSLCSCNDPEAASRAVWRTRVHARTGTYDYVEDLKHFSWSALLMTTYVVRARLCFTLLVPWTVMLQS
jgi:hypothetical protein